MPAAPIHELFSSTLIHRHRCGIQRIPQIRFIKRTDTRRIQIEDIPKGTVFDLLVPREFGLRGASRGYDAMDLSVKERSKTAKQLP